MSTETQPKALAAEFPFEIPLGRYAMNFGALEWTLIKGIAYLVGLDPRRHEKAKLSTTFGGRIVLFDRLAKKRISDPPLIETHDGLIKRIKRAAKIRNHLIHGPWFDLPGTNQNAQKSKLVDVPILLGDLLKSSNARSVSPLDIHVAILELSNTSALLRRHISRIKEQQ